MFKLALTLTLLALPATATTDDILKGIPTYRYFYSCDSGVVDCVNFDRNNTLNGDFGWAVPSSGLAELPTVPNFARMLCHSDKLASRRVLLLDQL